MFAVYLLAFFSGAFLVMVTMFSAIRTVVVPRGERVVLTRIMFSFVRWCFLIAASYMKDYKARDTVLARYAPTTLILLPVLWALGVLIGFAAMFWSIGARPISHTFELSGSSITTLGFHTTDNHWELALAVPEGLIGIGLVALLISYLPSIYNLFRERETMCTGWNIRAGSPPTVAVVVRRFSEIGSLHDMEETWREWEKWFVSNEEVTLSYPALAFFRSPTSQQSWITTAGNVLTQQPLLRHLWMCRIRRTRISACRPAMWPFSESPKTTMPISINIPRLTIPSAFRAKSSTKCGTN